MQHKAKTGFRSFEILHLLPYILVVICLLFNAIFFSSIWNYVDSVVLMKNGFTNLFPQHTAFYPLYFGILKMLNFSDFQLFLSAKVIQNLILALAIFYAIFHTKHKMLTALIFISFQSLFIIQNGVFVEAFFSSFLIFFLVTIYIYFTKGRFTKTQLAIHYLALVFLALSKQVGILFFITLPFFILIKNRGRMEWEFIKRVLVNSFFYFFIVCFNSSLVKYYGLIDQSMYGRPSMHIIELILQSDNKDEIVLKWLSSTEDLDKKNTRQFISDGDNVWIGPRSKVFDYISFKYPEKSYLERMNLTESLINDAYISFLLLGDYEIYSFLFDSAVKNFFPTYELAANLISDSNYSIENGVLNDLNWRNNAWIGSFDLKRERNIAFFIALENILKKLLFWTLLFSLSKVILFKTNSFELSMILLFIAMILAHSIFTIYLVRYTIVFSIIEIFIFIVVYEKGIFSTIPILNKKLYFKRKLSD